MHDLTYPKDSKQTALSPYTKAKNRNQNVRVIALKLCYNFAASTLQMVWRNPLQSALHLGRFQPVMLPKSPTKHLPNDCYTSSYSRALVNGIISDPFPIRQDIRQRVVLSTWMYLLFIDKLLWNLESSEMGSSVGSPRHWLSDHGWRLNPHCEQHNVTAIHDLYRHVICKLLGLSTKWIQV